MSDCQHCGGDTAKGMHYVTDVNGQNGFYACAPAFDCHFSDIRKEIEAAIWENKNEQQFFKATMLTNLLAKLEEKYGRSK